MPRLVAAGFRTALLASLGLTASARWADADLAIPVARPATPNGAPPVAQPVNPSDVPVAQPASTPSTPPVAQPVTPEAPATAPASPGGTDLVVVTNPAGTQFDLAMGYYNSGKFVYAVQAFSDFIRNFPQDRHREEALYRLADSYRNVGRPDDALAAYTFQVENYPDGPLRISGELRRGALLFDAGKLPEAITCLQYVADKGDGELQTAAKYLLGRAFLATQKQVDGRALLQPLADLQPPGKFTGDSALALAELDASQNKPAEALPLWQKALSLAVDPAGKASIAARAGWSAIDAKQPEVAEKLFQIARQSAPDGEARKVANTGLLRILFQQKRYTDWLTIYSAEKDKLLDSAQAEILYALGHSDFSLKHWPEAVAAFDQYLAAYGTQAAAVTAAYERFLAATQVNPEQIGALADAYLKAWPQSPYVAQVQLLQAQDLSRQKRFAEALPLWVALAAHPAAPGWPHQQILFEIARTNDILNDLPKAAAAYQVYLDDLSAHPGGDRNAQARQALQTQARLAVLLQKTGQLLAATEAWKAVQSVAPDGSPQQQMALESLALIYARGGPAQENAEVETFRTLLAKYPGTALKGLAAFSVGDHLFRQHDYAGAMPYLLTARDADAKDWMQPATQRLVLGAYGQKNYDQTVAYLNQYDTLPVPADPTARANMRLPAALIYWLAETARQSGRLDAAEIFYTRVTQHPDPGDLLAGAWWQLGEVQSQRKEWPAAVSSYEKYRSLKPEAKDATVVLLAVGRAQLGAKNYDEAKRLGDQALLQEPEGANSAASRLLLGEVAIATQDYAQATKILVPIAVLFNDPKITPQAMSRVADAFEKAGDAKSAAEWRAKLKERYPQFQPVPYL